MRLEECLLSDLATQLSLYATLCCAVQNALLKEVGLLAKLTHPNLVRFFGVCLDPPLVVMEYYRNGSVFKMLQEAQAAVQQGRANKVCVGWRTQGLRRQLVSHWHCTCYRVVTS